MYDMSMRNQWRRLATANMRDYHNVLLCQVTSRHFRIRGMLQEHDFLQQKGSREISSFGLSSGVHMKCRSSRERFTWKIWWACSGGGMLTCSGWRSRLQAIASNAKEEDEGVSKQVCEAKVEMRSKRQCDECRETVSNARRNDWMNTHVMRLIRDCATPTTVPMITDSIDEIRSWGFHSLNPPVMKGSIKVARESPVFHSSRNTRIDLLGIVVSQVAPIVRFCRIHQVAQTSYGAAAILNRKPTTVIVTPIVTGPV